MTIQNLKLTDYLGVKEPAGQEQVRFRRKLAVPITPGNPLYSLFFNPKYADIFPKQVTGEYNRLTRLQNVTKLSEETKAIQEALKLIFQDSDQWGAADFIKKYTDNPEIAEHFRVQLILDGGTNDMKEFMNASNSFIELSTKIMSEKGLNKALNGKPSEQDQFKNAVQQILGDNNVASDLTNAVFQRYSSLGDIKTDFTNYYNNNLKSIENITRKFTFTKGSIFTVPITVSFTKAANAWSWTLNIEEDKPEKFKDFIKILQDSVMSQSVSDAFIDQTVDILIDERINDWYRTYKDAKDKEIYIQSLIDGYKYQRENLIKESFPSVKKESLATGEPEVLANGNANIPVEGAEAIEAVEVKVEQDVRDQLAEISNNYYQLNQSLYEIRDIKKQVVREIRTSGYDIVESESAIPQGIANLGYDFAITKGDVQHEKIKIIDDAAFEGIIGGVTLKGCLLENKPLDTSSLDAIKDEFESEDWKAIVARMTTHANKNSWPTGLVSSMKKGGNSLVKDASGAAIPLTLIKEKQTEEFLLKGLHHNPWFAPDSAAVTADGILDGLKVYEESKRPQLFIDKQKKLESMKGFYEQMLTTAGRLESGVNSIVNAKTNHRTSHKVFTLPGETNFTLDSKITWKDTLNYFKIMGRLPDQGKDQDQGISSIRCIENTGTIESYTYSWKEKKRRKRGIWGQKIGKRRYDTKSKTINTEVIPPDWMIHIHSDLPDDSDWNNGYDYIRVIKEGSDDFAVILGDLKEGNATKELHSSSSDKEDIVQTFRGFIDACKKFAKFAIAHYDSLINDLKDESHLQRENAISNLQSLSDLRKYALTKARISFLLHWRSPGRFRTSGGRRITNSILPHYDPWATFLDKLQSGNFYNPLGRKVQIDHFTFQRNGYYTQDGLSMTAYVELLQGDDSSRAMRVAMFPVLDEYGQEVPKLRRAVINPEASYDPNPIARLPHVAFIEEHSAAITWGGFCLGELSHTENLAAGENKTITIEQMTSLKRKLVETFNEENVSEMKDTISVEEKLSEELNDKVSYEEEQKQKIESKSVDEKTQKYTAEKSREEVSKTSFNIDAGGAAFGLPVGGGASTSKDITKKRKTTQNNEQLLRDSFTMTSDNATKQGRETQRKDLREKIQKATSETSQLNKVSVNRVSESESNESNKRSEVIKLQNNNVGKALSYYFFQLQNIYSMKETIEDVSVVISPAYETIAKSKVPDLRVFHITELPNIYNELGGDDFAFILSLIVYKYAFENYFYPTNTDKELGADPVKGLRCDGGNKELEEDIKKIKQGFSPVPLNAANQDVGNQGAANQGVDIQDAENQNTDNQDAEKPKIYSKEERQQYFEEINNSLQSTPLEFMPIVDKEELSYTVNSGGLYMDTELGKQMATEPYLEDRRDIETSLKRAEVEHLNAKTKAGVFYPSPNITPAAGGFLSKLWPSSKGKQIATVDGETNNKVSA